jgi:hypothetical protein
MKSRAPQLDLLKRQHKSYGGELRKTQEGRQGPRPISTQTSMHMVLRSTHAKGKWSFALPHHRENIRQVIKKFSLKYRVQVVRLANVGNHLHFELRLSSRQNFRPFIRALTSAIAMVVTGASRWAPLRTLISQNSKGPKDRFWDYRPFTRIVENFSGLLRLRDYLRINQLEGYGYGRTRAKAIFYSDITRQRKFTDSG